MSAAQLTLFFFSGIGILNSLFFSVWLFVTKRGHKLSNRLLALLLIAFVVRVAKSIFYFLLDGVHIAYINAGLVGKVMIGPLLLLYIYSITRKDFQWKPVYLLHFIPALVLAAITPLLSWSVIVDSYHLAMVQLLVYLVLGYVEVQRFRQQAKNDEQQKSWLSNLCLAVALVWLAYLSQILMGGLTVYAIGAAWFALVMYAVVFVALKQRRLFDTEKKEPKYKTSNVTSSELDKYEAPLLHQVEQEKVYLDRALSLPLLAEKMEIRPDVLSRLINEKFEKNFNDFINSYRIQAARQMLSDPEQANAKIAGVAIDCGFKSISAFNTAFKKSVGTTPSQYRDQFKSDLAGSGRPSVA
ncbi:MAG: hypothetical protein Roseis2KO_13310 [Roseivirga sp.]